MVRAHRDRRSASERHDDRAELKLDRCVGARGAGLKQRRDQRGGQKRKGGEEKGVQGGHAREAPAGFAMTEMPEAGRLDAVRDLRRRL